MVCPKAYSTVSPKSVSVKKPMHNFGGGIQRLFDIQNSRLSNSNNINKILSKDSNNNNNQNLFSVLLSLKMNQLILLIPKHPNNSQYKNDFIRKVCTSDKENSQELCHIYWKQISYHKHLLMMNRLQHKHLKKQLICLILISIKVLIRYQL